MLTGATQALASGQSAVAASNVSANAAANADLVFAHQLIVTGKANEAIPLLESARKRDPNNLLITLTLADAYLRTGNQGNAIALLDDVIDTHPEDLAARLLLARAYEANRDFSAAQKQYEAIIAADPNTREGKLELADAYSMTGRRRDAAKIYRAELAQDPKNSRARVGIAAVELYDGEYAAAAADYRAALDEQDGNVEALLGLALVEYHQGDIRRSSKHVARALTLAPADADALELRRQLARAMAPVASAGYVSGSTFATQASVRQASQSWYLTPAAELAVTASRYDLAAYGRATHANRFGLALTQDWGAANSLNLKLGRSQFVDQDVTTDWRVELSGGSAVSYSVGYSVGGIDTSHSAIENTITPRGAAVRIHAAFGDAAANWRGNKIEVSAQSAAYSDDNYYGETEIVLSRKLAGSAYGSLVIGADARNAGFEHNYSYLVWSAHGYRDYHKQTDRSLFAVAQGRIGPDLAGGLSATAGNRWTALAGGVGTMQQMTKVQPYASFETGRFAVTVADYIAHYSPASFGIPYDSTTFQMSASLKL